jgi:hypothetical protein
MTTIINPVYFTVLIWHRLTKDKFRGDD